jgi:hypothetical protein
MQVAVRVGGDGAAVVVGGVVARVGALGQALFRQPAGRQRRGGGEEEGRQQVPSCLRTPTIAKSGSFVKPESV